MFKEEFLFITSILYSLFWRIEAEGILLNLFYETRFTLIQKSDNDIIREEHYRPIALMNTYAEVLNTIFANQTQNIKNYTPQPSRIYSKYARLIKYSKINECHPSHQQTEKEKPHDRINKSRKSIQPNPAVIHDKNSQ